MLTWSSILHSKARLEIALHVLAVAAVHGADPPAEEVAALRGFARNESERRIPVNALARLVIARECQEIASTTSAAAA